MKIIKLNKSNFKKIISEVTHTLGKGGLVVLPTDTVYGMAVDATNELAVAKLIALKSRSAGRAISVFVSDLESLASYVKVQSQVQLTLERLLPGPYTIILPSKHRLSLKLEAENGTLGVRLPDAPFVNNLVQAYGSPITATSANLSGSSPHYSVTSLLKSIPQKKQSMIDLIVDGGKLPRAKPSTVVDLTQGDIKILRVGDSVLDRAKAKQYESKNEEETKKIAIKIFKKLEEKLAQRPLVILLYGELGVGKTIFVKGIGEYLGIRNIVSPTFVIYYEYLVKKEKIKKLFHYDLYKLQDNDEFKHIGLNEALKSGNIVCIEWSEKSESIEPLLKKSADVVTVTMSRLDESKRKITLNTQSSIINQ